MQDLSLHILDIAQNSIRAKATKVDIEVIEDTEKNKLIIVIEDDGVGIPKDYISELTNPFSTTRKNRRVGIGLALLSERCELCEGKLMITSELQKGTRIEATFKHNHIDRMPIGNIPETLITLILSSPKTIYTYKHLYNKKSFLLDTQEIKGILEDVPIQNIEVIMWLKTYLVNHIGQLY